MNSGIWAPSPSDTILAPHPSQHSALQESARDIAALEATVAQQRQVIEQASLARSMLLISVAQTTSAMDDVSAGAERSVNTATDGQAVSTELGAGMRAVQEASRELAQRVRQLGQHFAEIDGMSETIREIASQSTLLSLNAAIEAAHAGEAGAGFAVVAAEMRKLAERSKARTQEILHVTQRVHRDTDALVTAMERVASDIERALHLSTESQAAFAAIGADAAAEVDTIRAAQALLHDIESANDDLIETFTSVARLSDEGLAAATHLRRLNDTLSQATVPDEPFAPDDESADTARHDSRSLR